MIKDIRETLDQVVDTQLDLPVQTANIHYKPKLLTPWARTTLLPSETRNLTLGNQPCVNVNGVFQVDIFYPSGSGTTASETTLHDLLTYFYSNRRIQINNSGQYIQIRTIWENVATTEPDWYQTSISLRYEYITRP